MCLKTAEGVANNVDPDQTLISAASGLGLHYFIGHKTLSIQDPSVLHTRIAAFIDSLTGDVSKISLSSLFSIAYISWNKTL